MLILGIESSCDETAAALYDSEQGLLAYDMFTQALMHEKYGGIVPEIAARDHQKRLLPLVQTLLEKSSCKLSDLSAIAYTQGPGLIGALLVGATFAKTLAWSLNIPSIGIHHMEGHLLAALLEKDKPEFPFVALLVSGGHTQLIWAKQAGVYEILGETLDDAAGEAFDKTARLLGLGYPGGPAIAHLAKQGQAKRFIFPRPLRTRQDCNFSFSGLKTFAMNTLRNQADDLQTKADIAHAFEEAVVESLFLKCKLALDLTRSKRLVVAGGVSANTRLREKFQTLPAQVFYPRLEFCTDNGAMIAFAGFLRFAAGQQDSAELNVKPRWSMQELEAIA